MWSWIQRKLFPAHYHESELTTVRFAFPIIALVSLFTGLAAVTMQDASYITITTEPSTITEGDAFVIDVKAYAHIPVNAVDIIVNYPEDQISIEGIDTGTSVITLWTQDPYAKDGKVHLSGGVFQKGFLGEHTIARVRAKAIASGVAFVNLDKVSLIAGDGKGTEVKATMVASNQTRVYVQNVEGALSGAATIDIVTDLNKDGIVGLIDISAFMGAWFSKSKTFDFNGDGRMTFKDFSILLADSFLH
jgi:hypothetical protein